MPASGTASCTAYRPATRAMTSSTSWLPSRSPLPRPRYASHLVARNTGGSGMRIVSPGRPSTDRGSLSRVLSEAQPLQSRLHLPEGRARCDLDDKVHIHRGSNRNGSGLGDQQFRNLATNEDDIIQDRAKPGRDDDQIEGVGRVPRAHESPRSSPASSSLATFRSRARPIRSASTVLRKR